MSSQSIAPGGVVVPPKIQQYISITKIDVLPTGGEGVPGEAFVAPLKKKKKLRKIQLHITKIDFLPSGGEGVPGEAVAALIQNTVK